MVNYCLFLNKNIWNEKNEGLLVGFNFVFYEKFINKYMDKVKVMES